MTTRSRTARRVVIAAWLGLASGCESGDRAEPIEPASPAPVLTEPASAAATPVLPEPEVATPGGSAPPRPGSASLDAAQIPEPDSARIPLDLPPDAPPWVKAAVVREGGWLFAVGQARGVSNPSLARATADHRARAALARALAGDPSGLVIRRLRGAEIVEHWTDPRTGVIFSRARLPEDGEAPEASR